MSKQPTPFMKGYKYRIYPTAEQKQHFAQVFGNCRFVWNQLLNKSIKDYEVFKTGELLEKPNVSAIGLTYAVKAIRNNPEFHWLPLTAYDHYSQTARDLGQAFSAFFNGLAKKNGARYPKFKSKDSAQSFRATKGVFDVREKRLWLVKCPGTVEVVWDRYLPNEPSSCTVSKNAANEYYVSFICEHTPTLTNGTKVTGIDLGLTTYATLSTGEKIDNPKWMKHSAKVVRRASQSLSRKVKGSNNRNKAKLKLAKAHQRVVNQRNDWQHKLSRTLVNENQVIGVESLKVANMIKNRKLSKHIGDVSWSSFISKLNYKVLESQHTTLIYVGSFFPSSHLCAVTGEKLDRKLTLSERKWDCPYCGQTHDRDVNAAQNIIKEAMRLRELVGVNLAGKAIALV